MVQALCPCPWCNREWDSFSGVLVLCHELPPGPLRTPQRTDGASSCQVTASSETLESVLWVEGLSVFMTSLVKKPLLTAELIGKFQRIFPCLREGCCVQISQDVNDLTAEPPYPCLKLTLELGILDFHGSHLSTEEGTRCRCPSIALYFPMQSCLFGWLGRFEPDSGEDRGGSQASVFYSPTKMRKTFQEKFPFPKLAQ